MYSNNENPNWIDVFEEEEQQQMEFQYQQQQQQQQYQSNSQPSTQTNITSMFTENEVKNMITNYNATMSNMIRDNDNLRQQNQIIEDQYFNKIKEIKNLNQNLQTINIEQQHYKLLSEKLQNQVKTTKNQVDLLGLFDDDTNIKEPKIQMNNINNQITDTHDQILQEINKQLFISEELKYKFQQYVQNNKNKENKLNQLQENNQILQQEVSQLQNQLMEYEQEKYKIKFCISCKQNFSPLNNEENSCVYHHGKLKYYSCRGCGGDEYWTCCNQCSKCKPGCRTRKHIPYTE